MQSSSYNKPALITGVAPKSTEYSQITHAEEVNKI